MSFKGISAQDRAERLTAQYAHSVAALLQPQSVSKPALAGFHNLRAAELRRQIVKSSREETTTTANALSSSSSSSNERDQASLYDERTIPQICRRCGIVAVPGWTGSVSVKSSSSGGRAGKRRRRRSRREIEEMEDELDHGHLRPGSKALFTCRCGWQQPLQTHQLYFKAVRPPEGPAEPISASAIQELADLDSTTPASRAASQTLAQQPQETPLTTDVDVVATESRPSLTSESKHATDVPSQVQSRKREAPTSSSTVVPSSGTSRKKRSKKDSLQAMLQARKASEEKGKGGSGEKGGLGLSNFLQSL